MPFTCAIDEAEGIVHITYTGECSVDLIVSAVRAATGDAAYRDEFSTLNDFRNAVMSFTPDDLAEIARLTEEAYGHSTGKAAIVLDSPRETALAMLHQRNVAGMRTTRLFSTVESALAWLRED
jgi:hypothetical protein